MLKIKSSAPIFIILASVFLAYFNTFENDFVWDDQFLMVQNKIVDKAEESLPTLIYDSFANSLMLGGKDGSQFYRPLQSLAYLSVFRIFGGEPFGFHLLNLVLHMSCAMMFYFLLLRLGLPRIVAFLSTSLWAVHPVHTEAITYMSGTADPLSLFFTLCCSIFFLKGSGVRNQARFLVISVVFLILALLTKESSLILPGLLTLLRSYRLLNGGRIDKSLAWKVFKPTLPFWGVSVGYFLLRMTALNFNDDFTSHQFSSVYTESVFVRFLTFLSIIPMYIKVLLWPHPLFMERGVLLPNSIFDGRVLFTFALAIPGFYFAYRGWRKGRPLGFLALFWFLVAMLPMSGVVFPANALFLEHWLYSTSLFVFVFVVKVFWEFSPKKLGPSEYWISKLKWGAYFFLICFSIVICVRQNSNWKDAETFYLHTLKHSPRSARLANNLANLYMEEEKYALAEKYFLQSIRVEPRSYRTKYNLARLYLVQKKIVPAKDILHDAIELNPNHKSSHLLLSRIFRQLGEEEKARFHQEKSR